MLVAKEKKKYSVCEALLTVRKKWQREFRTPVGEFTVEIERH